MKKRYYIAYGSNLSREQMAFRDPGREDRGDGNPYRLAAAL